MIIDVPIEYDIEYVPQGKRKPIVVRIEDTFPFDLNIKEYEDIDLYAEIKGNDYSKSDKKYYEKNNDCYIIDKSLNNEEHVQHDILNMFGYRKNFTVDYYNHNNREVFNLSDINDIKREMSSNKEIVIQNAISFLTSQQNNFLKVKELYYKKIEKPLLKLSLSSFGFQEYISLDLKDNYDIDDFLFPLELKDELLSMIQNYATEKSIKYIPIDFDIKLNKVIDYQNDMKNLLKNILKNICKNYKDWDIFKYNDEQMLSFLQLRKLRNELEDNISIDNVMFFITYFKNYIEELKNSHNNVVFPSFYKGDFLNEQLKIISNHDIKNIHDVTQKI